MRPLRFAVPLLVLLVVACGDSGPTEPPPEERVPAALSAITETTLTATVADVVPVGVRVTTAKGEAVSGVAVTFSVTSGDGTVAAGTVTTASDGTGRTDWVLGTKVGQNTLKVAAASLPTITFTASAGPGPPAILTPLFETNQTGPCGTLLPGSPSVLVTDEYRNPTPGVPVTYEATGDGQIFDAVPTTTEDALAYANFRLGPTPGQQTLRIQVGEAEPVTYTGTAYTFETPFQLDIRYEDPNDFTASQRTAIAAAVVKVQSLMAGSMPPLSVVMDSRECNGLPLPALNEDIGDPVVYIYRRNFETDPDFAEFKGKGGIGGSCLLRVYLGQSSEHRTSLIGVVALNSQSNSWEFPGGFERLVVHELLHSIGFGTTWRSVHPDLMDFVDGRGTGDPRFIGTHAVEAFGTIQGNDEGSGPVPVQVQDHRHWRSSLFFAEMMAPTVDVYGAFVSRVTVASLADLGWNVDLSHADEYTLYGGPGAAPLLRAQAQGLIAPAVSGSSVSGSSVSAPLPAPPLALDAVTGELIPLTSGG
jgi:hypothetical protein